MPKTRYELARRLVSDELADWPRRRGAVRPLRSQRRVPRIGRERPHGEDLVVGPDARVCTHAHATDVHRHAHGCLIVTSTYQSASVPMLTDFNFDLT